MKIAVQKNHVGGQILYRSLVPPKNDYIFTLRFKTAGKKMPQLKKMLKIPRGGK